MKNIVYLVLGAVMLPFAIVCIVFTGLSKIGKATIDAFKK